MINRRKFLSSALGVAGIAGIASTITSCGNRRKITGTLSGPNFALGHTLRDQSIKNTNVKKLNKDVVIVGGGVAGLSAAHHLSKQGVDFLLLELESDVGGNSSHGKNGISSYPLGAHYLPLPDIRDKDLMKLLEELGVITGYEREKPIFNEYYLCFEPKERLYINNVWQQDLVPNIGVPHADKSQINRFFELITSFRNLKGNDGKDAFRIPIDLSSTDPSLMALDAISFSDYLTQHDFNSPYLKWYLNYCCADDYGASIEHVSAWAGVHYFASRKGESANATPNTFLTWPEGNGWLVSQLKKNTDGRLLKQNLAFSVDIRNDMVVVKSWDDVNHCINEITANKVILSTPQFINKRIISPDLKRDIQYDDFAYAPWMIANLTMESDLNKKRGETLAWDNVIYGSNSMGYINANHQNINLVQGKFVITYYLPLIGADMKQEREKAYAKTYQDWYNMVIKDLTIPHPDIETGLLNMDIWIWGHGMICPSQDFLTSSNRINASLPIQNKIFFAHSDLSGISIFEEAFYRGTLAAKQVIAKS